MHNLKSILAYLLLLGFLVQNSTQLFIYADYLVNQASIIQNKCENKYLPQMTCHGKCHLKRELLKQQEKEQTPTNSIQEKTEIQYCSDLILVSKVYRPFTYLSKLNLSESMLYDEHLDAVYHPPQV